MIDRNVVHIVDLMSPEAQAEFPETWSFNQVARLRTVLAAPLLREGVAIGAIFIRSTEVRPFSEKHIALLKTRRSSRHRNRERALVQGARRAQSELREALGIRQQRRRFSASSAARPQTSSGPQPSSRVLPGLRN